MMNVHFCQYTGTGDPKVEDSLNLALDMAEQERERSEDLNVGYDPVLKSWELIIKYSGSLQALETAGIEIVYLMNGYAIITVPQGQIDFVAAQPQIEYIEKPKRLFFADTAARASACINTVQSGVGGLSGRGVIVALIDSGIDFVHSDFRNPDGTTVVTVSNTEEFDSGLNLEIDGKTIAFWVLRESVNTVLL